MVTWLWTPSLSLKIIFHISKLMSQWHPFIYVVKGLNMMSLEKCLLALIFKMILISKMVIVYI